MIRANISEQFSITATLIDENNIQVSGEVVKYDIRDNNDAALSPPKYGVMTESTVSSGIYKTIISIDSPGLYTCYVTCSGYPTYAEDIIINPENIYEIAKSNLHYNLSVEDVLRTEDPPTPSQAARNVPLGKTDYVINKIKSDDASDWSSTVASGIVYAHYRSTSDAAPYKMGGPF